MGAAQGHQSHRCERDPQRAERTAAEDRRGAAAQEGRSLHPELTSGGRERRERAWRTSSTTSARSCVPTKGRVPDALSSRNRVEPITARRRSEGTTGDSATLTLREHEVPSHKPASFASLVSGFARLRLARAALRFRVPLLKERLSA